ncbi:unnamed protein product [Protopolystoma xenopodis]|uniref:Uncharacterized protein n=1 Tax=Protopolystoma xenopodis TaxID=117903 RepID=A0A3S5CRW8_9PLAT|nr:unnamed protein product [Protopolystoma xenopodis]
MCPPGFTSKPKYCFNLHSRLSGNLGLSKISSPFSFPIIYLQIYSVLLPLRLEQASHSAVVPDQIGELFTDQNELNLESASQNEPAASYSEDFFELHSSEEPDDQDNSQLEQDGEISEVEAKAAVTCRDQRDVDPDHSPYREAEPGAGKFGATLSSTLVASLPSLLGEAQRGLMLFAATQSLAGTSSLGDTENVPTVPDKASRCASNGDEESNSRNEEEQEMESNTLGLSTHQIIADAFRQTQTFASSFADSENDFYN